MWESRKMLFGENAIRRPQLAANGQQLIVRSLADYTVGACTWQARYDYVSITYTNICACFPASPVMYAGYTIIPESLVMYDGYPPLFRTGAPRGRPC